MNLVFCGEVLINGTTTVRMTPLAQMYNSMRNLFFTVARLGRETYMDRMVVFQIIYVRYTGNIQINYQTTISMENLSPIPVISVVSEFGTCFRCINAHCTIQIFVSVPIRQIKKRFLINAVFRFFIDYY